MKSLLVVSFVSLAAVGAEQARAAIIASYDFSGAGDVSSVVASDASAVASRSIAATTGGANAGNLTLEYTGNNKGVIIAKDSALPTGVAQFASVNNGNYQWNGGSSTAPYIQFTLNNLVSLTSLDITARDGVEWSTGGAQGSYASNRQSLITVRTSIDSFASNVGLEYSPGQASPSPTTFAGTPFVLNSIDLTGLVIPGSQSVTFRIYAKNFPPESTGFHRTQFDDVVVHGTVVPEPASLAILGLGAMMAFRRRRQI